MSNCTAGPGLTCIPARQHTQPSLSPFIRGRHMQDYPAITSGVSVLSVLRYLDSMKRVATWHNDIQGAKHYEECWVAFFEATAGAYRSPVCIPRSTTAVHQPTKPADKPAWFTAKFSRPVREVIRRETRRCRNPVGAGSFPVSYDVLSCGHILEAQPQLPEQAPAKHRRCRECVQG